MNPIRELKDRFKKGEIDKAQFIEEMHKFHLALHDFSELIGETEISEISITSSGVVYTGPLGVKIQTDRMDQRPAPVDAFNFGAYERAETKAMLAKIRPGMTIFDVGANLGWYVSLFAKAVPNLKIHAFEPIPSTFKALKRNLALNEIKNCECHPFGLSNKAGEISFFYYPEGSVNASSAKLTDRSNQRELKLPVKTMDEFVSESGIAPDFIKCDVEGAELMVFQGAHETLLKHRPVVFTEMLRKWSKPFGYHPNDIIEFFSSLGYACYAISQTGTVPFFKMTDETVETNFLFLPN